MKDWHYSTGNGDTNGPVTSDEMLEAAKRGSLTATGLVYHAERTKGQWVDATEVSAIRSAIDGRAAILGKASNPPTVVGPPPVPQRTIKTSSSKAPGSKSKNAMLGLTFGFAALSSIIGAFVGVSKYATADDSGDGIHYILPNFASIPQYFTHSQLVSQSITSGIIAAFSIIPIYLLAIVVCFVFWFATKPE